MKSLILKPRLFYSKIFKVKEKIFYESFKTYNSEKPFTFLIFDAEEVKSFVDKNTNGVKRYCVMMEGKSANDIENITAGIRVYENGKIEEGYFKDEKLNGKCRIISPDGSCCSCDFKDELKNGNCVEKLKQGVKITCTYLRDKKYGLVEYEYSSGFVARSIQNNGSYRYVCYKHKNDKKS